MAVVDHQELAETYRSYADEELIRLAADDGEFTEEARNTLAAEMACRGLGDGEVQRVRKQRVWEQRKQVRREAEKWFDNNRLGQKALGKADRTFDPETGVEEFTTTLFYTFVYLPLIPIATYRVKRAKEFSRSIRDIEQLPLDWNQVLRVWCVAGSILLAMIWLLKIFR